MTQTCLLAFLIGALSIALQDRRITYTQPTWWAVNSIAVGMFLIGRLL
jgi:hypothetical protein